MNQPARRRGFRYSLLLLAATLSLALSYNPIATASSITLTDGASTVVVDPTLQSGISRWSIGSKRVLFHQWFWFRVGNKGGELSLDRTFASATQPSQNTMGATFTGDGFTIGLTLALSGHPIDGSSLLGTHVTITNTNSTGLLDFHLFSYSDFDLSQSQNRDVAEAEPATKPTRILQYDLDARGVLAETQTNAVGNTGGPNHYQIGPFPSILNILNDSSPTTLSDTPPPGVLLGPSDVTFAYEWDLTIQGGQAVQFGIAQIAAIPEPSSLMLVLVGAMSLLLSGWLRRFTLRRHLASQ